VGDLLAAELTEKQAHSIKYQMTIARMPFAKEVAAFDFAETPVNEALARDLAGGAFLAQQRNLVLVGGTGTGKTHIAVGIARACIRAGARGVRRAILPLEGSLFPPHLQRRRSREQTRGRGPRRPAGPARRPPLPPRLRRPRRLLIVPGLPGRNSPVGCFE